MAFAHQPTAELLAATAEGFEAARLAATKAALQEGGSVAKQAAGAEQCHHAHDKKREVVPEVPTALVGALMGLGAALLGGVAVAAIACPRRCQAHTDDVAAQ